MPGHAEYRVVVPKVDTIGTPLKDLAGAAHHYLSYKQPFPTKHVRIEPGKRGQFDQDHVVVHAEETPEADSHMKQLGAYVGELANHPTVAVSKQGAQGLSHWDIANSFYRPGEPAENGVISNEPDIAGMLMQQPQEDTLGGHPLSPYSNPLQDPVNLPQQM